MTAAVGVAAVQAVADHVEYCAGKVAGNLLGHEPRTKALLPDDLAGVGSAVVGQQVQQGALALAVAAQQAHALALFEAQVDGVEQRRTADRQGDLLERDEGHGASGVNDADLQTTTERPCVKGRSGDGGECEPCGRRRPRSR